MNGYYNYVHKITSQNDGRSKRRRGGREGGREDRKYLGVLMHGVEVPVWLHGATCRHQNLVSTYLIVKTKCI